MLDLRQIREDPEGVRAALERRGDPQLRDVVDRLLAHDRDRRGWVTEVNDLKATRNRVSKEVGERKRSGADAEDLITSMRALGDRISGLDGQISETESEINDLLLGTPNPPLAEVPLGGVEANEIVSVWGDPPTFAHDPLPHWEIGEALRLLDLAAGAKVSGSGFPVLRGQGARLQRELISWMLDLHVEEHGYEECRVPYLVTRDSLIGTGQLPKFAEESYLSDRDDLWLIPTAEVPLTNLLRDELVPVAELPVKYVAYTPCFRREAGAAGKDTRGLLRVHQFDKVELVRFEHPDRSREALEELTEEAATVLKRLGLHHRVVRLAAGDLGFSGALTYDLEVWAPGVGGWLEVSSCTTFSDYQARRMNIRFKPTPADSPEFVHTLNGSGVALPRLVVALLESGLQADGSVLLPEPLAARMGIERLTPPG
jgi:seryl-tRNA synthetase